MKLDRWMSGALTTAAVVAAAALACGCASTTKTTACAPMMSNEAARVPGTTNLMSAQMPGPAPKVGKSHLAIDEDLEGPTDSVSDVDAPKEPRRSDGSRRGGGFGTSSK
jgi:hypothetical protein